MKLEGIKTQQTTTKSRWRITLLQQFLLPLTGVDPGELAVSPTLGDSKF
jgi:hypothetical protein